MRLRSLTQVICDELTLLDHTTNTKMEHITAGGHVFNIYKDYVVIGIRSVRNTLVISIKKKDGKNKI